MDQLPPSHNESLPDVSIFIPVLNEEAILEHNLETLHAFLDAQKMSHEIVVVSNGSTDDTENLGKKFAQSHSWVQFAALPERGAGQAFQRGVQMAKAEKLVTVDADLSSGLEFIVDAVRLLDEMEAVVGSKALGSQKRGIVRIFGSQFYILLSQLLFDLPFTDYSIGCKAFRRKEILAALPQLDPWTGYILELLLFLRGKNKRIAQIPVNCCDQRKSHFNLFHEGWYRYKHLFRCYSKERLHSKQG